MRYSRAPDPRGSGQTRIAVWFLQVQEFLGSIIARQVTIEFMRGGSNHIHNGQFTLRNQIPSPCSG